MMKVSNSKFLLIAFCLITFSLIAFCLFLPYCASPCPIPDIANFEAIEGDSKFEAELRAAAILDWGELSKVSPDASIESRIAHVLRTSSKTKTEVSPEFVEWYKKSRLQLCTLMKIIEEEKKSAYPNWDFINDTNHKLVDLILNFQPDKPGSKTVEKESSKYNSEQINDINALIQNMGNDNKWMKSLLSSMDDSEEKIDLNTVRLLHANGIATFYSRIYNPMYQPSNLHELIENTRLKQSHLVNQFNTL